MYRQLDAVIRVGDKVELSKPFKLGVTTTPNTLEIELTNKISVVVNKSDLLAALGAPEELTKESET